MTTVTTTLVSGQNAYVGAISSRGEYSISVNSGVQGPAGANGANGISVTSANVATGNLILTLSDDSTIDAGLVAGSSTTDRLTNNGNNVILQSNGTVTLPGGSSLITSPSGVDLTAGVEGWAELQSHNANNYMWVDDNAAYIGTNWNTSPHQWTFDSNGTFTTPDVSLANTTLVTNSANTNLVLQTNVNVSIKTDGGNKTWEFANTGVLVFPDYTEQNTAFTGDANNASYLDGVAADQYAFANQISNTGNITFVASTMTGGANADLIIQTNCDDPSASPAISNLTLSWVFSKIGTLTFPDDTTQNTAFTGSYNQLTVGVPRLPVYSSATNAIHDIETVQGGANTRVGTVYLDSTADAVRVFSAANNHWITLLAANNAGTTGQVLTVRNDGKAAWADLAGSASNTLTQGNNFVTISSTDFTIQSSDKNYWISQFGDITGSARRDYGNSLIYDSQGNIIVVITDYTEVANTIKPMVVKYDPRGQVLWKKYLTYDGVDSNYVIGAAESLDVDSQDNIYVLTNDYDGGASYVLKVSPTGDLLDQIQINNTNVQMYDIVVDADGNYYLGGYNVPGSSVGVLKGNFRGITWQQGINHESGSYDGAYSIAIDNASPPNVYTAGSSNAGSILTKLDSTGTVQWTVILEASSASSLSLDASGNIYILCYYNNEGLIAKYDTDGNLIWQQQTAGINNPTEIEVGPDGYLYAVGITGYGPFNSAILITKLDTDGVVQWTNGLSNQIDYNYIGQWNWNGHKDITIRDGMFAITGYSQNASQPGGGYVPYQTVVAQFPTDGTYSRDYNDSKNYLGYSYLTLPWLATTTNTSLTSTSTTFTTADPGFSSTTSNTSLAVSTLTTSVKSVIQGAIWKFNETGNIVFPDGTEQSTAYPGAGAFGGEYKGFTANTGGYPNSQVSVRNASGYKRVDGVNNSNQSWFSFQEDIARQLGINSNFITGITLDVNVNSSGFATQGSLTSQIIISRGYYGQISVTHSESAVACSTGGDNDILFANLDLWRVDYSDLYVARTDSNTGQQLDILWTAKVFINPMMVEQYC